MHIVDILGSIDNAIENNEKTALHLEVLMQNLFEEMLIEEQGKMQEEHLTDIAIYTNGLTMQKYRPLDHTSLPVIKIRELSQGFPDINSERAAPDIDNKYVIDDGDIVFSWSGTLMVRIWCGGKGGLNQHLFKVTSHNHRRWFIYLWTKFHLLKFQNIANGKAVTMGHIKREDLDNTVVYVPKENELYKYSQIIEPLYDKIINLKIRNRIINELKQLYLKKFFG